MKILGIDPGYGITGFGLIDAQRGQYRLLGCGAITTPPNTDFPWRLEVIYNDMTQLLQTAQPEAVAIEELFFSKNITTGIAVGSFCWPSIRRGCLFLNTSPCRSSRPWWATATPASIRCRT